jgi:hypothetical protein
MSADKELPVVAWMDEGQTGGYGQPVSRVCTDVSKRDMPKVMADAMCIPLTYANAASARIAELEHQLEQAKRVLAQVRREIVHRPTCAIDMLPQLDAAIASRGTAQEVGK